MSMSNILLRHFVFGIKSNRELRDIGDKAISVNHSGLECEGGKTVFTQISLLFKL